MTREQLEPSAREWLPPAGPEVMEAAMVIFGAAVAARRYKTRLPGDLIDRHVVEALTHARDAIELTTLQILPGATISLEPSGALVIAWVVG